MLKKYLALFISIVIFTVSIQLSIVQASEEPEADTLTVSLNPTDDAIIRKDQMDQNFGTAASLNADIRDGSRRYGLIRFDASDITSAVDTASKIYLRYYASKQAYTNRVRLYPLYGNHKYFDENTLTWSIASGISEGGVSLADWLQDEFDVPKAADGEQVNYVDVTNYIKSQDDYVYAFKTWAKEGSDNYATIKSKEAKGFEPQLIFYTEVNYILEKAAEEIASSISASSLVEDFYLPSEWNNSELLQDICEVEWESSDNDIISIVKSDTQYIADVCERPQSEDKTAKLIMRVLYRGAEYEREIDVRVLREGIIPIKGDTYINGGSYAGRVNGTEKSIFCADTGIDELNRIAYLSFDASLNTEWQSAKRRILRLYPNNDNEIQNGTVYVSAANDFRGDIEKISGSDEISCTFGKETEAELNCEYALDIDVTELCADGGDILFRLKTDSDGIEFFSSNSLKPPQIILLNEVQSELYERYNSIKEELFERRSEIDFDFTLPLDFNGYTAEWTADGNIEINGESVCINRPEYTDGNKLCELSLRLSDGTTSESFTILLNILKKEAGGINGHRKLYDPMKLSDEDFFGQWNETIGSFDTTPVLQYDTIEGLGQVEYYAKRGNYSAAKEELLRYYRERDKNLRYEVEPKYSRSLSTQLASEHIIGNQSAQSVFTLNKNACWTEIEVPVSGGITSSYMLFDRSKDGSTGVFYSRQTEYAPYMRVVTKSGEHILPCTFDTYFEGGANSDKVNGEDSLLYVHEEGNPYNDNTKRTFINFDTSPIGSNEDIKSASIMIYGKKLGGIGKDMRLILYKSPLTPYLDETTASWNEITAGTFNFSDCIYDWNAPYNTEAEWINSMARLEDNVSLVGAYLGQNNGDFAAAALENIIDIYTYQSAGYPRTLDSAWRTPALLATMFGLMDSEYMTSEVFTAMLKYAYQMLVYFDTAATPSVVNQMCAADVGFARLVVYFPEIHDASYYERSRSRLDTTIGTKLTHEDGAYKEATTGYIHRVIEEIIEVIEMYEKIGYSDLNGYRDTAHKLATSYANCFFPDGELVPYGDSGRSKYFDKLYEFGEFFNDDMMLWQSHQSDAEEPEDYKSIIYPVKKTAIMRDGWNDNSLFAHITSETGHSHGHPDDLHIDIYAYGRPLLIDAGNGGGYNPILPATTVRTETYAHNTIEINDEPQGYDIGENGLELISNNSFDIVNGFAGTYDGFCHNRRVFFLHNGFWIVSDLVVPKNKTEENVYRQNWHPDNNANMETDSVTGKVKTHFSGTANLQILQADMDNTKLEIGESFIKDKNLENRLENYASYAKQTTGDAVFNTLLFPTKSGDSTEADFERIEVDGNIDNSASAACVSYGGKTGVYYISNEGENTTRRFGDFSTNADIVYAENSGDRKLAYAAMVNGSELKAADGKRIINSNQNIKDIAVRRIGNRLNVDTSDKLTSDIRIDLGEKVSSVSVNGTLRSFETDGNAVILKADKIAFPVSVNGSNKSYTFDKECKYTLALKKNGTVKNVTVTVPAGTTVKGSLEWDGEMNFSISENENGLSVIFNSDDGVSFDKEISISVPYYLSAGGYFINNGNKTSFGGEVRSEDKDGGCIIKSKRGAEYVFPKLAGALTASGGGGGGGGGAMPKPTVTPIQETPEPVETVKPTDKPIQNNSFSDIDGHWAESYIAELQKQGIIDGYEDNTYKPDKPLTRAEFVKLLVSAFDEAKEYSGGFSDVTSDDWFAKYVSAGLKNGYVSGYEDNTFRPNAKITREEAAKILTLVYESMYNTSEVRGNLSEYTDTAQISDWAYEYMEKAVEYGLIQGTDSGKTEPKGDFTRAMAAAVIYRMIFNQ